MYDTRHRNPDVYPRKLAKSRGAPRRGLLIGAGVLVLAVGPVAGVLDAVSSAGGSTVHRAHTTSAATTREFTIVNFCQQSLIYLGYRTTDGGGLEDHGPAEGTSIPVDGSMHFEQVYRSGDNTSVAVSFQTVRDNERLVIKTEVDAADTLIPLNIYFSYLGHLKVVLRYPDFTVYDGNTGSHSSLRGSKQPEKSTS